MVCKFDVLRRGCRFRPLSANSSRTVVSSSTTRMTFDEARRGLDVDVIKQCTGGASMALWRNHEAGHDASQVLMRGEGVVP